MRHLALSLLAIAACGGAQPVAVTPPPPPPPDAGPPPPPPPPARLRLTVLSASIDGKKPDGSAWDDDGPSPPPALRGSLAAYLAEHRELEGAGHLIGEPVDIPGVLASARKSSAPDPMVYLEVAGHAFRTTLSPGQFQPTWRFPVTFEANLDATTLVHITVVDWDGPAQADVIGDKIVPLVQLLASPVVELPRFGNVERLVLEATQAGELAARRRVAVAGRDGWTDSELFLVAGQTVVLRAAGEVCSRGGDRQFCAGPEGQSRVSDDSLPGFEPRPHAALIAGLGDTRFFVGRELRFRAPSSGRLLLGINDRDASDNSGEFEVDIDAR
jgi:hypothetical protein